MKFAASAGVYVPASYGPQALSDVKSSLSLSGLSISTTNLSEHGFVRLGSALVEVELDDDDAVLRGSVEALRQQQASIRADAESKAQKIEDRINSMLAICYDTAGA